MSSRGRDWKTFKKHDWKSLDCLEETVGRNVNVKGTSGEVSDGNEEHIIGSWKKGNPCDKMEHVIGSWKIGNPCDNIAENLAHCILLDGT